MIDVEFVQDHVEHHRVVVFLDQPGDLLFQIEGASAGQEIIHLAGRVLERDLDMIEPTLLECCDSPLIEAHAGSNQVRVIAEPAGLGDQDFQVRPHQRFSSRKSKLSCAEFTSLPQNAQPVLSRHLVAVGRIVDGVVTVHAVQRTPVADFGQQPERQINLALFESSLFHERVPETR